MNSALLTVTDLAGGASVNVAHGLDAAPAWVLPTSSSGSPIVATAVTATEVTFTNMSGGTASASFYAVVMHSILAEPAVGPAISAALSNAGLWAHWRNNRVVFGLHVAAPTTPSSQASGAVAPTWRFNMSAGARVVGGIVKDVPGSLTDVSMHIYDPGGVVPTLEVGQSVVAALVGVVSAGGSGYTLAVFGAPATTGTQAAPTDSAIRAVMTAQSYRESYVRIAKLTLNRTGDTTVTQSQDNTWRDY